MSLARELDSLFFPLRTGVTRPVLVTYYRSLAQCVESGISLHQALASLETESGMKPELARVTNDVRKRLTAGQSLSEAAGAHHNVFNSLAIGLIEVGETIGSLGDNLRRIGEIHLARHKMQAAALRRLIYPVVLVLVAAYIVPIAVIITSGISGYIEHVMPRTLLFIVIAAVIVFGPPVGRALLGPRAVSGVFMRIPLAGAAFRHAAVGRFARTLGTAVGAGVDMGKSLQLAMRGLDNEIYADRIKRVIPDIQRSGLAAGLRAANVFEPAQIAEIQVGETTGNLGKNLILIADQSDERADRVIKDFGRIVGTGLFVLVVVLSMFQVMTNFLAHGPEMRDKLWERIAPPTD